MRVSLRTLQIIGLSLLCLWFVLLTNTVSNLPPSEDHVVEKHRRMEMRKHLPVSNGINANKHRLRNNALSKKVNKNENLLQEMRKHHPLSNGINSNKHRLWNNALSNKVKTVDDEEPVFDNDDDYTRDVKWAFRQYKRKLKRSRFDRLRQSFSFGTRKSSREVKVKRKRKTPPILLPTPIIVMGFPKAGTSSIFTFFQQQGFRSQHWYCCGVQRDSKKPGPGAGFNLMSNCLLHNLKKKNRTSMFKDCGDFDVYSEINGPRKKKIPKKKGNKTGFLMDDGSFDYDGPGQRIFFPQHFRIQEIHDAYPNATWILNWRDFDTWIESVLRWGTKDNLHYQFLNEYYMQNAISSIPSPDNMTKVKEVMRTIYLDHFALVRNFASEHPSHALIELNITSENASTVLANAFGLDPKKWKHVNKNSRRTSFQVLRELKLIFIAGFEFVGSLAWWILVVATLLYFGWMLGFEWA